MTLGATLWLTVASGPPSLAADLPAGQTYLIPGTAAPLPLQPYDAIISPTDGNLYVDGYATTDSSTLLTDVETSRIGSAGGYSTRDEPPSTEVNPGEDGAVFVQPSLALSPNGSTLYADTGCYRDPANYGQVAAFATSALATAGATPQRCGALPYGTDGVDVIGSQGQAYGMGVVENATNNTSSAAVEALDPTRIGPAAGDYCDGTTDCFDCSPDGFSCDTLSCADLGNYGVQDDYAPDVDWATIRLTPDGHTIDAVTGLDGGNASALSSELSVIPTSGVDQTCGPIQPDVAYPAPQRIELTGISDGLALSPDGDTAYVPVSPTDQTAELDVVHGGSVVAVPLKGSVSAEPEPVAVSPDSSTIYVADLADNAISIVSTDLIGSAPGDYSATNLPPTVTVSDAVSVQLVGVVVAADSNTVYALTADKDSDATGGAIYPLTVSDTPPASEANLGLKVGTTVAHIRPSANARYVIAVHNAGPDPAANVVVNATLPPYLDLATTPRIGQSLCTNLAKFTCRLGTLAAGGSVSITFRGVGDAPRSGSVEKAIKVHVTSDSADSKLSNNILSTSVSFASPTATRSRPADPAYPFPGGKKIGTKTKGQRAAADPRLFSSHNKLPADCPPNPGSVPMGNGSISWCGRPYCRSDAGDFGTGLAGYRLDPWVSGKSGITRIQVDYRELAGDQNWSQDGSYTEASENFSDTNGTEFFVFFHAFSLGGAVNPDPGGQFVAETQIKFQHHYPGYNRTLYTTPWYTTPHCTEGGG